MSIKEELYENLDFSILRDNNEINETTIREEIILPLLKRLGYKRDTIIRELHLNHPFLKIGSGRKRHVQLVPDYVLKVENSYAWVLDAKGPRENILDEDYVEQVYSYAVHREIRSNYFALCNGIEFALYRTNGDNEPLLHFQLSEIDNNYGKLEALYRVLKFDRWMSFVFAHKDPEFWHLIIDTAEQCGFEYVGAVPQKNGQSSFKKRQNPFTVLSGQLIINFKKVRTPKAIMKAHLGMEIADLVMQTIEGVIANNDGATIEQINDELIVKGLELGFLDLLKKEYTDLTPLLRNNFDYDVTTQKYQIRKNMAFSTHIDVQMRIRYFLRSFLVRMERANEKVTFEDIIYNVMPLLKNGTTPENQTVLKVLKDIGQKTGDNYWSLKKKDPQLNLFG